MTATFFGHAANISDNGSQDATAARSITPPASMVTGDIAVVGLMNRGTDTMSVATTGGQTWNTLAGNSDGSPNMSVVWCRYNGTWGTNPAFQTTNALASPCVYWMLVFRPTTGSNTWAIDVAQVIGHTTTPTVDGDSTITGQTTVSASTVTVALLGLADDRICSLQSAGWSNPGGISQIRNVAGTDATLVAAYKIQTSAGATGNLVVRQTTSPLTSQWRIVTFKEVTATGLTLTDVDTDEAYTATQTNIATTATSAGSTQGTGGIDLIDGLLVQPQTITSWSDTSPHFDSVLGPCRYGARTLRLRNNAGATATIGVTVNPPSGTQVVTIATLRALIFDSRNSPSRLYSVPDIPDGAQVELKITGGTGSVTLEDDGRMDLDSTVTQIQWRWNNGSGWSSLFTWDVQGKAPRYIGPAPESLTLTQSAAMTSVNHAARFDNEDSATLTYSVQGGTLPAGTTLNSSTGAETGTPTTVGTTVGLIIRASGGGVVYAETPTFSRQIQATPNAPKFVGVIDPILGLKGTAITTVTTGDEFQFCTSFALTGTLPTGLSFNTSTGAISGTPTVAGSFSGYVVTGSGTGTPAVSNAFSIEIADNIAEVPDVVGDTEASAIADIVAEGLLTSVSREFSDTVTAGLVISQSPDSGTQLLIGGLVFIVVSRGVPAARVRNQYTVHKRFRSR